MERCVTATNGYLAVYVAILWAQKSRLQYDFVHGRTSNGMALRLLTVMAGYGGKLRDEL